MRKIPYALAKFVERDTEEIYTNTPPGNNLLAHQFYITFWKLYEISAWIRSIVIIRLPSISGSHHVNVTVYNTYGRGEELMGSHVHLAEHVY